MPSDDASNSATCPEGFWSDSNGTLINQILDFNQDLFNLSANQNTNLRFGITQGNCTCPNGEIIRSTGFIDYSETQEIELEGLEKNKEQALRQNLLQLDDLASKSDLESISQIETSEQKELRQLAAFVGEWKLTLGSYWTWNHGATEAYLKITDVELTPTQEARVKLRGELSKDSSTSYKLEIRVKSLSDESQGA